MTKKEQVMEEALRMAAKDMSKSAPLVGKCTFHRLSRTRLVSNATST